MKKSIIIIVCSIIFLPLIYFLIRSIFNYVDATNLAGHLSPEQLNALLFNKAIGIFDFCLLIVANVQLLSGALFYNTKQAITNDKELFITCIVLFAINIFISIFTLLTEFGQKTLFGIGLVSGAVSIVSIVRQIILSHKNKVRKQ